MALPTSTPFGDPRREPALARPLANTASASSAAVSWPAILAGAAGAAALSLILLVLGMGLDLSSTTPWSHESMGPTAMSAPVVAWVIGSQVLASGMGGYLAGRLRTRWVEVQRDDVHFRDTAHGFLAWAVAALVTATLLTQAAGAFTHPGLFNPTVGGHSTALAELDQRFALTPQGESEDMTGVRHAGQRLAPQLAALPPMEDPIAERRASAWSALWAFVALLSGAFAASLAANLGGRQRDA